MKRFLLLSEIQERYRRGKVEREIENGVRLNILFLRFTAAKFKRGIAQRKTIKFHRGEPVRIYNCYKYSMISSAVLPPPDPRVRLAFHSSRLYLDIFADATRVIETLLTLEAIPTRAREW